MRDEERPVNMSAMIINGDPGLRHSLKEGGFFLSPSRQRLLWPGVAFLSGAFLVAIVWKMTSHTPSFPRREVEFLTGEALDHRLDKAAQRLKANPDDLGAMVDTGAL